MSDCKHKAGFYFSFDGIYGCVACMDSRIKELETLLKAARDFIADEHIRRDIDTALLGGGEK